MKPPKVNREEVRTEPLFIKMNKAEKETLQKWADEMGITMSALVRLAVNAYIKNKEG